MCKQHRADCVLLEGELDACFQSCQYPQILSVAVINMQKSAIEENKAISRALEQLSHYACDQNQVNLVA